MRSITNLKTSVLISVFYVSMGCSIAVGSTIYVDDDATAGGNGESWENAYKYLQDAITVAQYGDTILVGQGMYKPDEDSAHPSGTGDRQATFRLKNGVALRGGYAGFGQPDPDARDPNTHETIFSGDLLGNDGPNFANNEENSYNVVTGSGTDATAVLDGFTITGGNANGFRTNGFGGGMLNEYGSPTVTNCTFSNNSAEWRGGGMCNNESCPTLTNCTFSDNSVEVRGGGMYNNESSPNVTNCTFNGNSAMVGGGMYNMLNDPRLTNCTFSDNSAVNGGGMCNNQNTPTLTNCTFIHNLASDFGGGMLNMGSSPLVTNSTFNNNRAAWGGGMENENNSNLSLIGCTIKANSVTMGGGAIRNHTSRPTVLNCLIVGNQAQFGGAIHNENSSSNPTFINCTISSNSATYVGGGIINHDSRPILNNCILWANSDSGGLDESAQIHGGLPAVNYCCFQGWTGNLGGMGNINADPWFIQPGYRDAYGVWLDGDYHLHRGSPCINTGDNSAVPPSVSTDLDGNPRIAAGTVDMGAYEDHSVPVTIYVEANASGENNGSSWADAFNDLQSALAEAQSGDEIRVARGAYSPEGPLPDMRRPSNPNPPDGAGVSSLNADLSWTAGSDATSHDVYFGTTSPPPFMQNQTATTFDPGTMAYGTTYYWRINEVGPSGTTTGAIWSFMTLSAPPPPPPPPPLANSNEQAASAVIDRTATFQLKNGVVIKGGYAGFGGPDPNARDIEAYETILNGDLAANDEPNFVNYEENSYHVVTGSDCNESAVLDGFTITAGNDDRMEGYYPIGHGAGMLNEYGSPTLSNCTFTGNYASDTGGGMFNGTSNPKLTNCTFIGNSAGGKAGGGIFNWESSPFATNCTFIGNSSKEWGGAICNYEASSPMLSNCIFNGNSARNGGGMFNKDSSPTLLNCTFSSNSTTDVVFNESGGGMYNDNSHPELTNCTFERNSAADHGGGMFNYFSSKPTLINCRFIKNVAARQDGGGMFNGSGSRPTLTNCLFIGNMAKDGGGMRNWNADPTLVNCTFGKNSASGNGGGVSTGVSWSKPKLTNCILWGNIDQDGVDESAQIYYGTPVVNYCCIQGLTGSLGGMGNIDADPCFVQTEYFGPIAYWKFDETSGTTAYDSVGLHHGTVYGAQWTTGQVSGALDFDGMNDYVNIPYDPSLNINAPDGITLSLWIKFNSYPSSFNQGPIFGLYASAGMGTKNYLSIMKSVYGNVISWDQWPPDYGWLGSIKPDLDAWYHLAVVEDSSYRAIYINGSLNASDNTPELYQGNPPDTIRIGSRADGLSHFYFNGTTDEFAIYNRVLSADEIQQDYLNGLSGQAYPDINTPDYHLLPNSPCINAGDPDYIAGPNETDLDGRPRVIGGRIDMGAYEFNHIPVADAGQDRTVEAQAPWGATVTLDGSGSSDADSTPGTNDDITDFNWYEIDPCDPNFDALLGSGRILDCNLSIGEHIILLEVIDKAGDSDTNQVTIIVQDTTPPDINCPQDVILECPADTTPSATGKATATDTCGTVTIAHSDLWQPGCGNTGILARTWTATDDCGNSSSCLQTLTVVDTKPPQLEFSVAPTMLWPPDHKMYEITPNWTVSDKCDASPDVSLVGIMANEGDDIIGDGHTSNDIQIGEDGAIYLRAERSGIGIDRIYTITYQAIDDCGNATVRSATVSIPHDFRMLARIASRWLWTGPGRIPEDLNGDGIVNLADFARFADNWIR